MTLIDGVPSDRVAVTDRGLAYGDGVFRTLRAQAGVPQWWTDQVAVLMHDARALGMALPDPGRLYEEALAVACGQDCVVKIVLTRGAAQRGYASVPEARPTRIVMAQPLPPHAMPDAPREVAARTCTLRLAMQPQLAGIKHLNRLENVLARAEWQDTAIFEGLLCDTSGMLVGGIQSNLFWVRGRTLFTPALDSSGISGVTRARLMARVPRLGLRVAVCRMPPAAILEADEVLITNSLIRVRRLASLDGKPLRDAGWRARLDACLDENLD